MSSTLGDRTARAAHDLELDARVSGGESPAVRLVRALKGLRVGGTIAVLASDPRAVSEMTDWVRRARHAYVGAKQSRGYARLLFRKTHA